MKPQEELNAPKAKVETLNETLHELTGEELAQVVGGKSVGGKRTDSGLGRVKGTGYPDCFMQQPPPGDPFGGLMNVETPSNQNNQNNQNYINCDWCFGLYPSCCNPNKHMT